MVAVVEPLAVPLQVVEYHQRAALPCKSLLKYAWIHMSCPLSCSLCLCHLQQTELQLVQQSRKLSGGRGSGLLPLTDSNGDSTNADMRTVQ